MIQIELWRTLLKSQFYKVRALNLTTHQECLQSPMNFKTSSGISTY